MRLGYRMVEEKSACAFFVLIVKLEMYLLLLKTILLGNG